MTAFWIVGGAAMGLLLGVVVVAVLAARAPAPWDPPTLTSQPADLPPRLPDWSREDWSALAETVPNIRRAALAEQAAEAIADIPEIPDTQGERS
jgi:hypothetical protein